MLVFFDDILIYSKSTEEHKEPLQLDMEHKKCDSGRNEVAYLGHIVSSRGVAMHMEKVQAALEWPTPCNLRELQGFLSLTSYYRKIVAQYTHIARPLTEQLKDSFGWMEAAMAAFERLKKAMVTTPVLAMPNCHKLFVTVTDASGCGVGAVLMQSAQPIAFYSKLMGPRGVNGPVW